MHNIKVHGNLKGFKNLSWKMIRLRARFTNSLRQCKPSFGVKIVMAGFTRSEELALKRHGQLFLHLTLLNMHL